MIAHNVYIHKIGGKHNNKIILINRSVGSVNLAFLTNLIETMYVRS